MDFFSLETIFPAPAPAKPFTPMTEPISATSKAATPPPQTTHSKVEEWQFETATDIALNPLRNNYKWPFPDKPAREVQLEALAAADGKTGFAFFMRQRLGKTLTAYAEFKNLLDKNLVDWFFVICPNSLKEQWRDAIEEVDLYARILVFDSQNKNKLKRFFKNKTRGAVVIVNYESMDAFVKKGGWENIDTFRTYCVADESTKIKDPSTRSAKACLEFADMCRYTRVLSGKPTANSNADIWSQLKFIRATNRTYHHHKYTFCSHGGYMGKTIIDNINTEQLQKEMAPHCYIAPDKYIQGFSKEYEPLRRVNLLPPQQKQYKQMEDELVLALSEDTSITAPIALVKYLRLQQISSGVAGDPDGVQHNLIDPFINPRINVVRDLLDNEIDGKCIIACRFRLSIDNLARVLEADGHKVVVLKGNMSSAEIEEVKAKFNGVGADVLIGQLSVLSYGHTLPGPDHFPCKDMIFYENDFSLLNRMQCESRPEKYERGATISYWDMYCSKMDKYILNSLRKKEEGSLALMGYARETGLRPSTEEVDHVNADTD